MKIVPLYFQISICGFPCLQVVLSMTVIYP